MQTASCGWFTDLFSIGVFHKRGVSTPANNTRDCSGSCNGGAGVHDSLIGAPIEEGGDAGKLLTNGGRHEFET